MRTSFVLLIVSAMLTSCGNADRKTGSEPGTEPPEQTGSSGTIEIGGQDLVKLQQIFENLGNDKDLPVPELVSRTGMQFLGTPYVAHTLEKEPEQLVINLRELDCTTFGENCLALARTIHSGELTTSRFAAELKQVRYRNGVLDGYPSRLHYFCDWIHNNAEKGLIRDVSRELGGIRLEKEINFMSTHPDSYSQLARDSSLVEEIRRQEELISARELYYLPEGLVEQTESGLKEGDLVGITTSIEGIAIMHVGILVRKEGRIHLLHASSAAGRVVVSEEPLADYLLNSERATGIMVARPL